MVGWLAQHYFLGDEFILNLIDITSSMKDIYLRLQNEKALTHFQQQAESNAD
jgi:hypothetical protein